MKVHGGRILVRQKMTSDTTDGGIALPETSRAKLPQGEVLAVSVGIEDVEVGDVVLFNDFAGNEVEVNGEVLKAVHQDDVLVSFGKEEARG